MDVKEGENRKTAILLAHHIIDNKKSTDLQGLMEYFITLGDVEILKKMIKLELNKSSLSALEQNLRKRKRKNTALYLDENFQFIAGYPEGGVPFGIVI